MRMIRLWRRLKYRIGLTRDRCFHCGEPATPRDRGFEYEPSDECADCMSEALDREAVDLRAPASHGVIEARAVALSIVDMTPYQRAVAEREAAERLLADARAQGRQNLEDVRRLLPLMAATRELLRAPVESPLADLATLKSWLDQPGDVEVDDTDPRPNIRFRYPQDPSNSCTFYVSAETFRQVAAYAIVTGHPAAALLADCRPPHPSASASQPTPVGQSSRALWANRDAARARALRHQSMESLKDRLRNPPEPPVTDRRRY
jgi:hypothetical protein